MIAAQEHRWIVLADDGRHVTLGRHTDPSQEEVSAAETALRASRQAGWLAVMRGRYYSREAVELLMVRPLGDPAGAWSAAVHAFEAARQAATGSWGEPQAGCSDPRWTYIRRMARVNGLGMRTAGSGNGHGQAACIPRVQRGDSPC